VDFKNTMILMSSNLGAAEIQGLSGDEERMRAEVTKALRAHFRPELLNRLDETLIFKPLSRADLRAVVDIQLRRLEARLADSGVSLRVSEGAKAYLAAVGYDPDYGARPLKRALRRWVEDPLAVALLSARGRGEGEGEGEGAARVASVEYSEMSGVDVRLD